MPESRYQVHQASEESSCSVSGDTRSRPPTGPSQVQPPTSPWVEPTSLPSHAHATTIQGNAPDYVKQLNYNTFMVYGVGEDDAFGGRVGRKVRFVDVSVHRTRDTETPKWEATTVAEVEVDRHMLNGVGILHGGCIAYLIDNCCSTPLVVLGLILQTNGVGVTQSMNIQYHSPATLGTLLRIESKSISLGRRVMSSRCEISDKRSGKVIASAFLNKMQPKL